MPRAPVITALLCALVVLVSSAPANTQGVYDEHQRQRALDDLASMKEFLRMEESFKRKLQEDDKRNLGLSPSTNIEKPIPSWGSPATEHTEQPRPYAENASTHGTGDIPQGFASLLGRVAGKLFDPLAWIVVAAAIAAGGFMPSWAPSLALTGAIAVAVTAANIALVWPWWIEIGGPISPRIISVSQAMYIITLVAWVIARSIRAFMLHEPYQSDPTWTKQDGPALVDRLFAPQERTVVPAWQWRYWVAGSVVWIVSVLIFVFVFEPFGRYWRDAVWMQFWTLLVGPSAIAALGLWLFAWAGGSKSSAP